MDKLNINDNTNEALDIATSIGLNLLSSGADIKRVENTINYVLTAYGAEDINVFSIPSLIIASCTIDGIHYATKTKRNQNISTDLYRIEKYNSLSREIVKDKPSYEYVEEKIKYIQNKKDYNHLIFILGGILACLGFTLFFGGTIKDAISSGVIGAITVLINFFKPKKSNNTLHILLSSLIGGFLSLVACWIGLGDNISVIMVGAFMINIPGITISISIRDILVDDIVSGSMRLFQSVFITLAIVAGFSVFAWLYGKEITPPSDASILNFMIGSLLGTLGFAIIFNSKYKRLPFAILGGLITAGIYLILYKLTNMNTFFIFLITGFSGAIYSEIMARVLRGPSISFMLPSLIPLVPGSGLFFTIYELIIRDGALCINYLVYIVLAILGIGLGLTLSTAIFENIPKRIFKNRKKQS